MAQENLPLTAVESLQERRDEMHPSPELKAALSPGRLLCMNSAENDKAGVISRVLEGNMVDTIIFKKEDLGKLSGTLNERLAQKLFNHGYGELTDDQKYLIVSLEAILENHNVDPSKINAGDRFVFDFGRGIYRVERGAETAEGEMKLPDRVDVRGVAREKLADTLSDLEKEGLLVKALQHFREDPSFAGRVKFLMETEGFKDLFNYYLKDKAFSVGPSGKNFGYSGSKEQNIAYLKAYLNLQRHKLLGTPLPTEAVTTVAPSAAPAVAPAPTTPDVDEEQTPPPAPSETPVAAPAETPVVEAASSTDVDARSVVRPAPEMTQTPAPQPTEQELKARDAVVGAEWREKIRPQLLALSTEHPGLKVTTGDANETEPGGTILDQVVFYPGDAKIIALKGDIGDVKRYRIDVPDDASSYLDPRVSLYKDVKEGPLTKWEKVATPPDLMKYFSDEAGSLSAAPAPQAEPTPAPASAPAVEAAPAPAPAEALPDGWTQDMLDAKKAGEALGIESGVPMDAEQLRLQSQSSYEHAKAAPGAFAAQYNVVGQPEFLRVTYNHPTVDNEGKVVNSVEFSRGDSTIITVPVKTDPVDPELLQAYLDAQQRAGHPLERNEVQARVAWERYDSALAVALAEGKPNMDSLYSSWSARAEQAQPAPAPAPASGALDFELDKTDDLDIPALEPTPELDLDLEPTPAPAPAPQPRPAPTPAPAPAPAPMPEPEVTVESAPVEADSVIVNEAAEQPGPFPPSGFEGTKLKTTPDGATYFDLTSGFKAGGLTLKMPYTETPGGPFPKSRVEVVGGLESIPYAKVAHDLPDDWTETTAPSRALELARQLYANDQAIIALEKANTAVREHNISLDSRSVYIVELEALRAGLSKTKGQLQRVVQMQPQLRP